jgi:parallel beta-helix repeat protein
LNAPQSSHAQALPACGVVAENTTLQSDCLAPLVVAADNLHINMNNHRVVGTRVQSGIVIYNRTNVYINNGTVETCSIGVDIRGGGEHRLDQLQVSDNAHSGVFLVGSTDNRITNSAFNRNHFGGVYLTANANRNHMHGLAATQNDFDGVVFDFGSSENAITASDISQNGRFGIYFFQGPSGGFPSAAGNRIQSSTISANGASGLIPSDDNVIRGNDISNNGNYGILVTRNTNVVQANRIGGNHYTGIAVLGSDNAILANTVAGSGIDGITAGLAPEIPGPADNVFQANISSGNARYDLADFPPGPCALNTWKSNQGVTMYDGCEGNPPE